MFGRIAVIGGGPAGMISAGFSSDENNKITLIEKNTMLGKKLNITGKGRCNLSNMRDLSGLLENIPQNPRFLYGAFSKFTVEDTIAFFESLGVKIKKERGERLFPESDNAHDVTNALIKFISQKNVEVKRAKAAEIIVEDGMVKGVRTANGETVPCGAVILATGGRSYPGTGSTGEGYAIAEKVGHTVVPARASLVPLLSDDDSCREMQGLSLKNVSLTVFEDEKPIYRDFGEMLFTHFGLSGPMSLSASAHMRNIGKSSYKAVIDLKPALDQKTLDMRILRDFEKFINRDLINCLGELLPQKMIPVVIKKSGVDPHIKANSITKKQREDLIKVIKGLSIEISGFRPIDEAIITSGGVSVAEINPKTMGSKIVKGLFFAGEIIDVDGYTGGFNLQIAWSTGHLAGVSAKEYILSL